MVALFRYILITWQAAQNGAKRRLSRHGLSNTANLLTWTNTDINIEGNKSALAGLLPKYRPSFFLAACFAAFRTILAVG